MAAADRPGNAVQRLVRPKGNLLNDNDSGVDQLEYLVYAQALAKLLHNCQPPITVGIFAPWGNGKTFLLKHVQGLLRKFERQQKYDVKLGPGEAEDTRLEALANKKPKNKTRQKSCWRYFKCQCYSVFCTLLLLLIIAAIALAAILYANPRVGTVTVSSGGNTTVDRAPEPRIALSAAGNGTAADAGNSSDTGLDSRALLPPDKASGPPPTVETSITATAADVDIVIITSNARLYVTIALMTIAFVIFTVFCCCIANTSSKCWPRFRRNYSLVLYAAFTRLPSSPSTGSSSWVEASDPYMVINLNDEQAELRLLNADNDENIEDDEILGKTDSIPTKYVFVNFHAWEYAGSDTLWAGIVTTLSDVIEEEFGSVSVRLFRMMQVERPSKSGPFKTAFRKKEDPRAIYVHLRSTNDENIATHVGKVQRLVREYGVVTRCCYVKKCAGWWFIRFSNTEEAAYAQKALKLAGFNVRRVFPVADTSANNTRHRANNFPMTPQGQSRVDRGQENPLLPGGAQGQGAQHDTTCCCSWSCCRCCKQFRRHPKTVCCGCPYLYCCIIFAATAIVFPVAVMIMAADLNLQVLKGSRAIPLEAQILSWFPAALGIFVIAVRFCWAMCHSQTERIKKALAGASGNMADKLGFMNNVKKEVKIITQLINCARFTHKTNYRVVITIDDLDRCPNDKVKSVLEAVSILLSDRSSPFICIVAVDSRVAVKCIEQDMGDALLQANLTGHEYLKKIINVPFCLPEVSNNAKQRYVGGLMDIADVAVLERKEAAGVDDANGNQLPGTSKKLRGAAVAGTDQLDRIAVTTDNAGDGDGQLRRNLRVAAGEDGLSEDGNDGEGSDGDSRDGTPTVGDREVGDELQEEETFPKFLLSCREFLQGDESLLGQICGNPRNIKRIFNVLSMATHMMQCIEERRKRRDLLNEYSGNPLQERGESAQPSVPIHNSDFDQGVCLGRTKNDAEDLVRWIVLTDQWPYRISYILQVIEDSKRRRDANAKAPVIKDSCKLSEVYERYVEPEIDAYDAAMSSMLSLDQDPALLRSLLRSSERLTRKRVASLFPVTLNLDQALRNGISRQRSKPKPPTTAEAATTNATGEEKKPSNEPPTHVEDDDHRAEERGEPVPQ